MLLVLMKDLKHVVLVVIPSQMTVAVGAELLHQVLVVCPFQCWKVMNCVHHHA